MFSPDGKWLGFAGRTSEGLFLKKVAVTGGEPVKVCKLSAPFGASWGPDDAIVYGLGEGGLMRVSALGGEPERFTEVDTEAGEDNHRLPHWLPDGKALLYTSMSGGLLDMRPRVFVHIVETGERKLLIEVGMDARYVPTFHLVFAREGRLLAVPFDLSRLEVTGREVPVLDGVAHLTHTGSGGHETKAAQFDLSSTGTLVYAPGSVFPELETPVVWVDREGREEPLGMEPRGYWSVRISPDGGSVLLNAEDVWLFDVERKTSRRQTFEGAEGNAIWGPEPDRFSFTAKREGISALYSKGINSGPGNLQRLPSEPGEFNASSWSSDGKRLAFVGSSAEDVWVLDAEGHSELFLGTQFIENYPEFSPDGRWIVHTSNESGRPEVYVRPYPSPGPSVQISRGGGSHPAWSRDGREIFYRFRGGGGLGQVLRRLDRFLRRSLDGRSTDRSLRRERLLGSVAGSAL